MMKKIKQYFLRYQFIKELKHLIDVLDNFCSLSIIQVPSMDNYKILSEYRKGKIQNMIDMYYKMGIIPTINMFKVIGMNDRDIENITIDQKKDVNSNGS